MSSYASNDDEDFDNHEEDGDYEYDDDDDDADSFDGGNQEEQRWVPYRHTNGVAIYHHNAAGVCWFWENSTCQKVTAVYTMFQHILDALSVVAISKPMQNQVVVVVHSHSAQLQGTCCYRPLWPWA